MIKLIEASNYRCLKYVNVELEPFQVLVGPNASGKTTFLDVVAFLGQLVSEGLDYALRERTQDFRDLTWGRIGGKIELALEALIPESVRDKFPANEFDGIRYEVLIGIDAETQSPSILAEQVSLTEGKVLGQGMAPRRYFPEDVSLSGEFGEGKRRSKRIVTRTAEGKTNFYTESANKSGRNWVTFKLNLRKSALGNLPEDESKYPTATWLKLLLSEGVQTFVLNSLFIRKASPPSHAKGFKPDGSNLPWIIHRLREKDPPRFRQWLAHLRTALGDIEDVRTIERADDRHRYLVIKYNSGLEVPSWMTSDGTLRLMALTLPAYISDFQGVYLIEEPENGIHPRAVESVFQSLSSVYGAQILLATHSPVVLATAKPKDVLCFAKTAAGITDIVRGDEHPSLRNWQQETNLGELFAAGVLG
jgi:predicted ATPase